MYQENKRVMEKLIAQARQAHQARKPLILVDTEEGEMMERLARECGLVALHKAREADASICEDFYYQPYYSYLGIAEDALQQADNFSYETNDLKDVVEQGCHQDYQGVAQLRVVHLLEDDPDNHLHYLRKYVHAYIRCRDNGCALRSSCILLYGDPEIIPRDLRPYTEVLTVDYPQRWEIQETLYRIARENQETLEPLTAKKVAELMVGFTLIQVEEYARRLLWADGKEGKPLIFWEQEREEIILSAKAQAIRSTGNLLTLYWTKRKAAAAGSGNESRGNSLGGMQDYKKWVFSAGIHMRNNEKFTLDLGLRAMKGVLLCGVPGCGKSEAAKILHESWGLPMLRLDVDNLMGGVVGESERNMRQALALAEAMSPCILWIDEIEKGFSGSKKDDGDGGTFKRMFGRLLTWMQENEKPCFIFATANDISDLPPEFFRSGRFDALFSVYMPTNAECIDIFREQMHRAERLRRDTAKQWGFPDQRPALFDSDCYKDETLQAVMNLFTAGRDPRNPEGIKFVSGADICKITGVAVERLAERTLFLQNGMADDSWSGAIQEASWEQLVEQLCPISPKDWLDVLKEVMEDPSLITQGSSSANLDQIAACCVRMMRGNFAPVSPSAQQLFNRKYYRTEGAGEHIRVTYTGTCPQDNPYDQALFHALKGRIEFIGSRIETNALENASR